MKLLVAIKRVVDYNVKIRVKGDGSDVELANVKMGINPFCEIAVEEGVRLREAGIASELVVVTFGPDAAAEQLRHGLALGADRALHYITCESVTDEALAPLTVARALHKVCEQEQPDLVLLGKQSIDSDNNQVAQMLAALNDWPLATCASALKVEAAELLVTREIDGGLETLGMPLPAVVSADLRLNEPRFASLPNIMKAKRKPLDSAPFSTLAVEVANQTRLLGVMAPPARSAGIKVGSVDELVDKLKHEAKVLP
ncbi:electron transfer flavoprotein subunit beta/FixA family protein [Aeromonas veronii]|uniref:electron transfer flavoprotein subunit beta/FixA family protein n=1 Tax=Aeromonas TaxID=642 RepID=UPI0007183ADC|nr:MULTISPECIES: electron transfer flavoprotein subunit beta/FixA family protein [Aeromonas]HDN9000917.1 electron transfer flavoprotein subunit beta/FixA family protein [Aeromonas veronii AMC24]KRV69355.1 electron transporter RnfB [Aeromonas veronii]KRV73298.1 electron transporter RnfB [Aeromonas veronii]KRV83395.1 electron transporter RnfB [Aeromonas veronii]KRV83541.1 electron transporter RnfB [Aeromonas veronii]